MTQPVTCELSRYGLIRFTGEDAQTFLHNQLSCEVSALASGRVTYGAYCTPKGRILASFLLWRSEQGFFMQLPSSLREAMQKQLSKFILRSKVKAADASGDWTLIGVAGTDAAVLVQRVIGQAPQGECGVAHTSDATVIRLPGERFEIAAAKDKALRILDGLAAGAEKTEAEHWEWLDIRAGIPTVTPATQEAFVPQMVNLDVIGGVSFEKGCYPGQEIVARMHYRGTLKQRMYLVNIAGSENPQAGDKLYGGGFGDQACGTIVNAARSPGDGYDALAVIQIAGADAGGIHWKTLEGPLLKLLPLPYAVPAPA